MDELIYKEVDFFKYCPECRHQKKAESEHPCDECLENTTNLYSQKPVNFKKKKH